MRVRRMASSILGMLATAALYGCGSGSNYNEIPILSGSYTGRFVQITRMATETGTMSVVIGPDHRLAGTVFNETRAADGVVVGDIENGAVLDATLTYPDAEYRLTGKIGKDDRQYIVGALSVRNSAGTSVATLSVDLEPTGSATE